MEGKYLEEARRELLEAAEGVDPADGHGLRALSALTEALAELEARVTKLEVGPHAGGSGA